MIHINFSKIYMEVLYMASRSANVLIIFIIAIIAFCLASVCASMTGPISFLPNQNETGVSLDNLSLPDDNVTTNNNYNYKTTSQNTNDKDDTSSDDTSTKDTSDDTSSKKDSSNTKSSSDSSKSSKSQSGSNVETTTDTSSGGSGSDVETTTSE